MMIKELKLEIESAIALAISSHDGQTRRDGKTPYVTHPIMVSMEVPNSCKPAALLHDVLEDTEIGVEELRANGISDETITAVQLLTKIKGEEYFPYIARLKLNWVARMVKIEDIEHNLSSDPNPKSVSKYKEALKMLRL